MITKFEAEIMNWNSNLLNYRIGKTLTIILIIIAIELGFIIFQQIKKNKKK